MAPLITHAICIPSSGRKLIPFSLLCCLKHVSITKAMPWINYNWLSLITTVRLIPHGIKAKFLLQIFSSRQSKDFGFDWIWVVLYFYKCFFFYSSCLWWRPYKNWRKKSKANWPRFWLSYDKNQRLVDQVFGCLMKTYV